MTLKPRALVVYESFFGNTREVAEAVGRGLALHFDVKVLEVSEVPADRVDADLLIVGAPIHAMSLPRPQTREQARTMVHDKGLEPVTRADGVREWLANLAKRPGGVGAAAFDTAIKLGWFAFGSAARGEGKRLREHGYELLVKPEHFWVKGGAGPMREGELSRAEAWGHRIGNEWKAQGHVAHEPIFTEVHA